MTDNRPTAVGVLRAQALPVVMVFLLPLIALGFTGHALGSLDERFVRGVSEQVMRDQSAPVAQREAFVAFLRRNPPSQACESSDPELAEYRRRLDGVCGDLRQFLVVRRASRWALVAGALSIAFGGAMALLAATVPSAQFTAFVVGWRAMQLVAALETLAQGALAVWLSYWLTAFFANLYVPKLILVVAFIAAAMAWHVVKAIFITPAPPPRVEAVRVEASRAEALFARIRDLCARVGTEAPTNLLVGIDDNFFVTETPLDTTDGPVEGRTLFVSLSLLRVLDRDEADAVLAHEMGHFVGGDTAFTRKMGPRLAASQRYLVALYQNALPVFWFMRAFFTAFDLALVRTERDREFAADALAARTVSGGALARALVKVAAYASYRTRVENKLFAAETTHATLSIPARIAEGFAGYVNGDDFRADMAQAATPHPFDTHPRLEARMEAVHARIPDAEWGATALAPVVDSWLAAVTDAEGIEARMWADYERRFATVHEFSLALRYLPSTPEEEALVVKHFPERVFSTQAGDFVVTFRDLRAPDWSDPLALADMKDLAVNERMFKKYLDVTTADGAKRSILLSQLAHDEAAFLDTLSQYVGRRREAERAAADRPDPAAPA